MRAIIAAEKKKITVRYSVHSLGKNIFKIIISFIIKRLFSIYHINELQLPIDKKILRIIRRLVFVEINCKLHVWLIKNVIYKLILMRRIEIKNP